MSVAVLLLRGAQGQADGVQARVRAKARASAAPQPQPTSSRRPPSGRSSASRKNLDLASCRGLEAVVVAGFATARRSTSWTGRATARRRRWRGRSAPARPSARRPRRGRAPVRRRQRPGWAAAAIARPWGCDGGAARPGRGSARRGGTAPPRPRGTARPAAGSARRRVPRPGGDGSGGRGSRRGRCGRSGRGARRTARAGSAAPRPARVRRASADIASGKIPVRMSSVTGPRPGRLPAWLTSSRQMSCRPRPPSGTSQDASRSKNAA